MADNTTTTTPQSNGVPLSGLPALTAPVNGEELLLITKNNQSLKTTAAALKAYINAEMATLAGMQQAVKAVSDRIDTLVNGDASSAIDTFNEIEAFLMGITDTETLTGLLAELKSAITTETDNKLSGKVDKVTGKGLSTNDYTDEEKAKLGALLGNEQYTIKGYFLGKRGNINASSSEITGVTPLLPLSKTYPIVLKDVLARGNAVALCFYDATGSFISYPEGIENLNGDFTVSADKYPASACYFIACSEKAGSTYTNGPTIESRENATVEAIAASKLALFVDQFNAAAGPDGKYDPANAPDPQYPFYLNTLWLTYGEAIAIMLQLKTWGTSREDFVWYGCVTNIPKFSSTREYSNSFHLLKVVNFSNMYPASFMVCLNSDNLTKILNLDATYLKKVSNSFNTPNLEVLEIRNLKISLDLSKCPLINLASWQGLVTNAANTEAITVTVHPTVYAKLTDEDADISAYLPENKVAEAQNDEWMNVPVGRWGNILTKNVTALGLHDGDKVTISVDTKSLSGRRLGLHVAVKNGPTSLWGGYSEGIEGGTEGRETLSFTMPKGSNILQVYVSALDVDSSAAPLQEAYKGLKISLGEHSELPYTEPLSKIEDVLLRERAEWVSLMQDAEARQITFATTE